MEVFCPGSVLEMTRYDTDPEAWMMREEIERSCYSAWNVTLRALVIKIG